LGFFPKANHRANRTEIFNFAGLEVMVLLVLAAGTTHQ